MTPKERAREATRSAGTPDWGSDDQEDLEATVEMAIIAAVEAEREACDNICEEEAAREEKGKEWGETVHARVCLGKIRARSNASSSLEDAAKAVFADKDFQRAVRDGFERKAD